MSAAPDISNMPLAKPAPDIVSNVDFYPDFDIAEFVTVYSIPSQFDNLTVRSALTRCMSKINRKLSKSLPSDWVGVNTLADVPAEQIDGQSELVIQYKLSVFALAKSELLISELSQTHRDKASVQKLVSIDNKPHWVKVSSDSVCFLLGNSENLSVELL